VGPAGSVAPSYASFTDLTGTSRQYRYTWSVPVAPAYSTVGYSIVVADAAGNVQNAGASDVVTIGNGVSFVSLIITML